MAVVEIELADLWDRVIEHVSLGEPQASVKVALNEG